MGRIGGTAIVTISKNLKAIYLVVSPAAMSNFRVEKYPIIAIQNITMIKKMESL